MRDGSLPLGRLRMAKLIWAVSLVNKLGYTNCKNLWSSDLWCEAHISWGWAAHWSWPVQPLRFSRTLVFAPHASVLVGRHAEQETPSKAMGHTSWTYWIQLVIARTCKNRLVEMEPEMNDQMKLDLFVAACRVTLQEGILSYLASSTWSGMVGSPNSMYGNSCMKNVWALKMHIITAMKCLRNILYIVYVHAYLQYTHDIQYNHLNVSSTVFQESFPIYSIAL